METLKRLFDEIDDETVYEEKRPRESEPDTSLECYDNESENSSAESSGEEDVSDDFSVCSDEDVQDYVEDTLWTYNGGDEAGERARLLFDPDSDINFAEYIYEKLLEMKQALQDEIDDLYTDGDYFFKSMKEKYDNLYNSYHQFRDLHTRIKNIYETNNHPRPELENKFVDEVKSVLTELQNELNSGNYDIEEEDKEYYRNQYRDALTDFKIFVGQMDQSETLGPEFDFAHETAESLAEKFYELDEKLEERDQLVESINALEHQLWVLFNHTDFLKDENNVALAKLRDFVMRNNMELDIPIETRQDLFHKFTTIEHLNTFLYSYNDLLKETVDKVVQKGRCAMNEGTVLDIDPDVQELAGISKEQRMTDLVFDKKKFKRLCDEILYNYSSDRKFDEEAIDALQTAAEDYLVDLFGKTIKATIQRNATVDVPYETTPRDMNFIVNLTN